MTNNLQELYDYVLSMDVTTLPKNALVRQSTAVAIAPGGGHESVSNQRLTEVDWENYTDTVLVAGTNDDPHYTKAGVCDLLIRKGRRPKMLSFPGFAENTKMQADWLARQMLIRPTVATLLLSTAEYHLPRFALTFIKSWQKMGDGRLLHTALLPTERPDVDLPDSVVSQTPESEIGRIEIYQEKGDVATYQEAAEFFGW